MRPGCLLFKNGEVSLSALPNGGITYTTRQVDSERST